MKNTCGLLVLILSSSLMSVAHAACETVNYSSKAKGKQVELKAELCVPTTGTPPFRTIILQHSSGPEIPLTTFNGRTDGAARAVGDLALQRGYAVIFTDSFTPRGIDVSNKWGTDPIGSTEMAKDIFSLVRQIQKDERINHKRLFLYGQSQGGGVAIKASYLKEWERADFLKGRPTPFAAVFASAPGCHVQNDDAIGQPLKIMTGENDDWSPVDSCLALQADQRKRGVTNIEVEVVPGVIHSWSTDGGQWNPDVKSYKRCQDKIVFIKDDGRMFRNGTEISKNERLDCITKGATSRGNLAKIPFLAERVVSYFDGAK